MDSFSLLLSPIQHLNIYHIYSLVYIHITKILAHGLKSLKITILATLSVLNLPPLYPVHLVLTLLSKLFVKYVYLIILFLILKHWDGCLLMPFSWILSKTYNIFHFLPPIPFYLFHHISLLPLFVSATLSFI